MSLQSRAAGKETAAVRPKGEQCHRAAISGIRRHSRLSKLRCAFIARACRSGPPDSGRRHQRLPPLNPVPANPYVEKLNIGAGRRALAIGLAILFEGLLLLVLLSFGSEKQPEKVEEGKPDFLKKKKR